MLQEFQLKAEKWNNVTESAQMVGSDPEENNWFSRFWVSQYNIVMRKKENEPINIII